jgi:ABC-type glycerol-3-phosphate transport system substrate-binding protein
MRTDKNVYRGRIAAGANSAALAALALAAGLASAQQIELSFWTNLTTASQTNVIQKQVNECIADKPNVKVQFETVPQNVMYTRLITALKRGEAPNVMNTLEGAVAFLQARDGLVPVTDVIDGLGRSDFLASYLNAVSKDGQIWGVPDWALHQEVWYRKDLFAAAGLKPAKSWPELLQVAKKLNQEAKDGKPAMYGFQVFYSAGGTVFDPKTGAYVFDKQKALAAQSLRFLIDLYKAASPPASIEWGFPEYRTALVKGQVAMTNEWGAVVLIAAEQNPEMLDKISVFPFPGPTADKKPAAALNGGYYYLVGKSTPEKVAASKALLKCMYTVDRVAARANSRPIFAIPATRSAFNSATYQSNPMVKRFKPELDIVFNEVMQNWYRYGMEAGLNQLAGQIEATTFVGDAMQNAALGKISVEAAIDQMDQQFKAQTTALAK